VQERSALLEEQKRQQELVRRQDVTIREAAAQVRELEVLLEDRTKQTCFLTEQLQTLIQQAETDRRTAAARITALEAELAQPAAEPVADLAKSLYRSFDAGVAAPFETGLGASLGSAKPIPEPEESEVYASDYESDAENDVCVTLDPDVENSAPSPNASPKVRSPQRARAAANSPQRARVAARKSLDSAPLANGVVWRLDVEHILRCLARALQDKVILSVREARPHSAAEGTLELSSVFLDPQALKRLHRGVADVDDLLPDSRVVEEQRSNGRVAHALNDIAVRRVPSTWNMYVFLNDAMSGWRLRPEVAVVTLLYVERFTQTTGLQVTPDNWERLTITCMMLASKVWDDDSYENAEFAKICPLYSVDEINTMERVFLKLLDYKVIVGGSEYAAMYFRLRVLGARDQASMQAQLGEQDVSARGVLQPLDNMQEEALARRGLEKQNEWREKYHAHLAAIAKKVQDVSDSGGPLGADPDPLNWTL
jgi:hypothetical protein